MTHDQDDAVLPEGDLSSSSSSQDDEEEDDVLDEEDDVDDDDDVINLNSATSNSNSHHSLPVAVAAAVVTVASLPAAPFSVTSITPTAVVDGAGGADPKRPRTIQYDPVILPLPTAASTEEKKPVAALDDSRRLFQRLWTDEDEIELLQGFLDYTTQRGSRGGGGGQNDTALFYDQIKSKLQLEFNKNQLVEKLRRLKKKYRNLLNKIAAGKDVSFKSPHDQATFEISRKIWSNIGRVPDALDDEEQPNPNPIHSNFNLNSFEIKTEDSAAGGFQKSMPRSRKRSRPQSTPLKPPPGFVETPAATITTVIKENHHSINNGGGGGNNSCGGNCNVQGLIEETVKSCLSPLFKELVSNAMGGGGGQQSRGFGGMSLNAIPLSFGGPLMNLNFGFGGGEAVEEQWRNQQILELEVYSKRLELVQNQIKVALDELRSTTG